MSVQHLIGSKTTLAMYRDCLKVAALMQPGNLVAQENIKKHFRMEFEK